MTDGCGFINRAALRKLSDRFGFMEIPTAIQFRCAGGKVRKITINNSILDCPHFSIGPVITRPQRRI